jgi:hypothetical protein
VLEDRVGVRHRLVEAPPEAGRRRLLARALRVVDGEREKRHEREAGVAEVNAVREEGRLAHAGQAAQLDPGTRRQRKGLAAVERGEVDDGVVLKRGHERSDGASARAASRPA